MTTCCFHRSMRCGSRTRALRSLLPPSENGMTMRTTLPGNGCAKAEPAASTRLVARNGIHGLESMAHLLQEPGGRESGRAGERSCSVFDLTLSRSLIDLRASREATG